MSDNYNFKFLGGPIDDADNSDGIFEEIGKAAASWARLEQLVEAMLLHVNKRDYSDSLYQDHPISFTKKLNILKSWFEHHDALLDCKDSVLHIISKLWELSEERNLYLHSILEEYDENTKVAVFHRIQPIGNDKFNYILHEIPLENISAFTEIVNITNNYLWKAAEGIFSPDLISKLEGLSQA